MAKPQVIVYRVGGTKRFEWRRSIAVSPEEAKGLLASVQAQGYKAFTVDAALSLAIGLPETFEASSREAYEARRNSKDDGGYE